MKKLLSFTAIALVFATTSNVKAQVGSDTASAEAQAEIIQGIDLTKDTDMDFGQIYADPDAGDTNTVVLGTDGTITVSGPGGAAHVTGTGQVAAFSVDGVAGSSVTVSIGSDSILIEENGGTGEDLTVDSFTYNDGTGEQSIVVATPVNATLDSSSGQLSMDIGATLNLDGGDVSGVYDSLTSGETIDITVAY
jgi:hypothetical protein